MIGKIWSCDKCQTVKSCAGVVLIGAAVAVALLTIRLVGERRLQRFLNIILLLRRRQKVAKLAREAFVSENQT